MCPCRNIRIVSTILYYCTAYFCFTSSYVCDRSMITDSFWCLDLYLIFIFPVNNIYAAAFAAAAAQLPVVNP